MKQYINEIRRMQQLAGITEIKVNNPSVCRIVKIELGRDTGMARGAIGLGYKITLSDGTIIDSDDEDLLDRYEEIRQGGRKSIEQLNNLLVGKEYVDYDNINEIKVNNPSDIPIPSGWKSLSIDLEPDPEEDMEIESYGAPMEGWDENHLDVVSIMKTPKIDPLTEEPQDVKYYVRTYISFGDYPESEHFDSYYGAKEKAVNIMNDLKSEWDEDDLDNI
jgi:hypothetical protein